MENNATNKTLKQTKYKVLIHSIVKCSNKKSPDRANGASEGFYVD